MKIAISTESTCDLTQEQIDSNDIKIIPYTVILGDDMVTDNADVPAKIFKFVEETKTLPKTSAINESSYKEYFEELLKNEEDILHICFSSALSGTYATIKRVADELNATNKRQDKTGQDRTRQIRK